MKILPSFTFVRYVDDGIFIFGSTVSLGLGFFRIQISRIELDFVFLSAWTRNMVELQITFLN